MYGNRVASLALASLLLWAGACTSYRQIEPLEVADYGQVRVTTRDGKSQEIRVPRVRDDSISGLRYKADSRFQSEPVSVPMAKVSKIEAPAIDEAKTVGLVLGSLTVVYGTALLWYPREDCLVAFGDC